MTKRRIFVIGAWSVIGLVILTVAFGLGSAVVSHGSPSPAPTIAETAQP